MVVHEFGGLVVAECEEASLPEAPYGAAAALSAMLDSASVTPRLWVVCHGETRCLWPLSGSPAGTRDNQAFALAVADRVALAETAMLAWVQAGWRCPVTGVLFDGPGLGSVAVGIVAVASRGRTPKRLLLSAALDASREAERAWVEHHDESDERLLWLSSVYAHSVMRAMLREEQAGPRRLASDGGAERSA